MIQKANLFIAFILLFSVSCNAQKLMQTTKDARKIQANQKDYEGKPLKFLLSQIKPEIKFIYGTPEGNGLTGNSIKLFFVSKEEYKTLEGKKSIGMLITFYPENPNNRKPIPVGGVNTSTKEVLQNYGDMIVYSIYVTGSE